jgi:hypothetical protein
MRLALRSGACVVGFAACACAGAPDAPSGVEAAAINLGELSPDADNAVVEVRVVRPPPLGGDVCTGTLVAPNLMLTSLECATLFDSSLATSCRADGTLETSTTSGGVIGDAVTPSDLRVYYGSSLDDEPPSAYGAQIFVTGTTEVCEDDLAAVVLDRALPSSGYGLRLSRDVSVGEELTAIGWGYSMYDARFKRNVTVTDVGPDDVSDGTSAAPPRSFLVGSGLCWGDRGAPALSTDTGMVAGIYARPLGGGLCFGPDGPDEEGVNRFVEIAPYESLLREAFDAAGATLVSDLPASPSRHKSSGCAVTPGARGGSRAFAALVLVLAALCVGKRARRA